MKNLFAAAMLLAATYINAQLKSPGDYLPNYGKNVSYYHQVEGYFAHLVQSSDMIKQKSYGQTTQERNLNVFYISTPENLKELENIRFTNLREIGMSDKKPTASNDKAIVWLSFNVHGNEPGATESAMSVAYQLINPDNKETKEWLQNTIVILDPCLNPDGFSRYGNWLRDVSGKNTHPGLNDREHMEPWPGGRQNHYDYDLNRDWAWQTQAETQQRMVLYNEWMPMVHVDVHEMGYNEPYFFPPAAEPMHDFITKAQRDFHSTIGDMTAKKFDTEGWNYYTRERFDLFYPSYGDTYPSFNGAVGMTYEQGGIGAGRAVTMANGNVLTLQDRIDHHTAAVLTAVETASWKKDKLVKDFRAYFKDSRENLKGKYKTYVVKNSGKTEQLARLLKRNKIQYSYAAESKKTSGYSYQSDKDKDFAIEPNDLIVRADQPKAVLTQVLFEPSQRLTDSLSYDITAWALPHAYGVESYALKNNLFIETRAEVKYKGKFEYERIYAYYVPWNGRGSARTLSLLLKSGIKVRSSRKSSAFRGIKVSPGDLIILKGDNTQLGNFKSMMETLLDKKPDYEVIESGFSLAGGDLGGENYPLLQTPKVVLLSGNDVSATDFGQAWFYMDEIINYPVSIIDTQNLGRINLSDFTTLILPDGWYDLPENSRKKIDDFIDNGGKVIAIANALNLFEDRTGYSLTKFASSAAKDLDMTESDEEQLKARFYDYQNAERRAISASVPGAIVENVLDKSHPLSYGLGDKYFSLKTTDSRYQLLKNAWNVAYVPAGYKNFGFIGKSLKKKLENTVTFAVEQKGRGEIIYMVDNPLFRGFWENGNLLFSNALFLVN
ncbi:M14 family zinc carboxypeptidase [Flavobacterium sp. DG1-102-2]|uniref:M14 family zinc carboxypeptidase n=1 Tax=Flavobacterium sp. DG1-102-2 TaxID=3081663 RepID=UPI00294974CD|nr:M14 family zinc carboxypeptidase [Flavobacterium sp. DG1-102-2]MDV6166791.1 M14 family zinc carboxypeptidase [Flavobacterium sp. DG1-102-2]